MDRVKLKSTYLDRMSDDEFYHFCEEHEGLRIERSSNLEIFIMSPTGSLSGNLEQIIGGELFIWNQENKTGVTFSSSTGFTLPDRTVFSPDASWVSLEKWNAIPFELKEKFAPVCPEFVVELMSKNDDIQNLQKKMTVWMKNGSQLGWLINPYNEEVYIYNAEGQTSVVKGFDNILSGEPVLPKFSFYLKELKL
ncbi:MAG TPA: Uma2 family endonuclease [Cytophagaceae bacterium]|jgi:Uma2 family endonuclease